MQRESVQVGKRREKVIIIDTVLEDPKQSNELVRAQHNMDMLMMVLYAAKERTKKEWEKLFTEAGFTECKIIPALGLRFVHLYSAEKLKVYDLQDFVVIERGFRMIFESLQLRTVITFIDKYFCCKNLPGKLGEPIAFLSQLSMENIDDLGNSASFDGNSDGLWKSR
ncbi:hypothetical protein HAX54_048295 [Datura stramonium]|uniref:O-methyltransferase C-terminal domain-containing protein n=1 Tax=Datura stramonium TaxID=4076 RepID=A0ABS8STM0_DATST|nr:hypothetical protein [Datura stramonium]